MAFEKGDKVKYKEEYDSNLLGIGIVKSTAIWSKTIVEFPTQKNWLATTIWLELVNE